MKLVNKALSVALIFATIATTAFARDYEIRDSDGEWVGVENTNYECTLARSHGRFGYIPRGAFKLTAGPASESIEGRPQDINLSLKSNASVPGLGSYTCNGPDNQNVFICQVPSASYGTIFCRDR